MSSSLMGQFVLYDPGDQTVLAEGHTVPLAWDGTDAGRGPGIDATIAAAFELRAAGGQPTAVSALAAEIPPRHRASACPACCRRRWQA